MPKFKIKFTRDANVERAPSKPGKGGFDIEHIPAGTEKEVNDASLNFWLARGCVELLGRVEDPKRAPPAPPAGFAPFGSVPQPPVPPVPQEQQPLTKTALTGALTGALAMLDSGKYQELVDALAPLHAPLIDDALADLPQDPRMVLDTAIEDARTTGKIEGNPAEVREALLDALDALLPPSRRRRLERQTSQT